LQEALVKPAEPRALYRLDGELVIAARLVQTDLRQDLDLIAVARHEVGQLVAAAEHRATDLRPLVLQREVPVAAGGSGEIGDLAADPHQPETAREQSSNGAVQRCNRDAFPRQC
jgi:hypothetical protein